MPSFKKASIVATLLLVALVGVALAEVVYDSNVPLPSAAGDSNTVNLSSNDASTSLTSPVRPRLTNNCSKVVVSPTFSVQGASACFEIVLYQRSAGPVDTYQTIAVVQTVTATVYPATIGGRYVSNDGWILAPTLGCQVYDVRLIAISSGNVNWKAWTLGSDSQASGSANQ